jgi:hypothetical protein
MYQAECCWTEAAGVSSWRGGDAWRHSPGSADHLFLSYLCIRPSVAELKQLVSRPDVVEMNDVTARDQLIKYFHLIHVSGWVLLNWSSWCLVLTWWRCMMSQPGIPGFSYTSSQPGIQDFFLFLNSNAGDSKWLISAVLRIRDACPGSDVFYHGSRVDKIPNRDLHQRIKVFLI